MILPGTRLVDTITAAMLHNSGLFLRKAAEEIAGHDDHYDCPFDTDRATLVAVLIQMAVELACTALVLRYEGFAGVVREKDRPPNETEAKARWEAGTIRTLPFESLKESAAKYLGDEDFWSIVDFIQTKRNKLVHFHAPLAEDDRFDMKYDATHMLIQVAMALVKTEDHQFGYGCREFLGQSLFDRLLAFEPYRDRIAARCRQIDPTPLTCPICEIPAFVRDDECCLACGWMGEIELLKCLRCGERAVFYDHLNLPFNVSLKARCGRCDWEGRAAHCAECDIDYLIERDALSRCPWIEHHG